ncbi:MBG domain-containing protein [beta proteobacterium MWH-UniP1]
MTYSVAADGVGTSRGLANGETLTGALARSAGENVGNYAIGQGTLTNSNNSNYAITYVADSLTVTRRPITLTANAATKIYGDADAALSVTASATGAGVGIATTANGNTVNDTLADITGTLSRQAGSNVGSYDIALGSGSKAANYDITFAADNNAFTITRRTVTLSAEKTYDGSTSLTGNQVTIGNLVGSEKLTYTGATSSSKHVATAGKYIDAITLVDATDGSGGLESNYQLPTLSVANAPVTITAKTLTPTISNTGVTKVYDGTTTAPGGFTPTYTFSGLITDDTAAVLTNTGAAYNSATVAGANQITVSGLAIGSITGTNSSQATDYVLDATSKTVAATISRASLTVTADNKSRVYGDANPTFSQTITGYVNGENATSANVTGSATGSSAATATSNVGSYTITGSTGNLAAANYSFTAADGALTVNQRPITLTATNQSKTYGDGLVLGTSAFRLTSGSFATGESATAATLSSANGYDASTTRGVGAYANEIQIAGATGTGGFNASNYQISYVPGDLTIRPRTVTLTATKVYDGSTSLTGSQVTIGTGVGSETLTYTNASANSKHVAGADGNTTTADNFIAAITLADGSNGGLAGNYQLPTLNATNAPVTITAKTLTPTVSNTGVTKVYDGTTTAPGGFTPTYTFSGLITDDTAAVLTNTGAAYNSATVAGANQITVSGLAIGSITGTNSSQATDYVLDATSKTVAAAITPATLSATGTKVYDGSTSFAGSELTVAGVNNEVFTASGFGLLSSRNVQTNEKLSSVAGLVLSGRAGAELSNYFALTVEDTTVSVTRKSVTLSAPSVSKVYDGSDVYETKDADLKALSGKLMGSDTVSAADILFASKDANTTGISVTLSNVNIDDGNAGLNYNVGYAPSTGTITPAPLTVRAVDDADFVTKADSRPNYAGVVYTGFVAGETAANLVSNQKFTIGTVTRPDKSDTAAKTYSGVLVPTGFGATNYAITPVNGSYTIVPADTLLVRVAQATAEYSAAPSYTVTGQYLKSDNTLISPIAPTLSAGVYTIDDGAGSVASFKVAPVGTTLSRAGHVIVGGYNLDASDVAVKSASVKPNFEKMVLVGALQVTPKILNNVTNDNPKYLGITSFEKEYDGNASIVGANLNFDPKTAGVLANDQVTVQGVGYFNDRHVGVGKQVTLSMALRGTKVGDDSKNYALPEPKLTDNIGTITQRAEVSYEGTDGGDWSSAQNWAGGAIPDGNNVGRIVIPQGVSTVYDSDRFGATQAVINNAGTVTLTPSTNFTLANLLTGSGVFAQAGLGTLTVSGTNTGFAGSLDIGVGEVVIGNANALGVSPRVTSAGGRLNITKGLELPSLTINGTATVLSAVKTTGNQIYNGALTFLSSGTPVAEANASDPAAAAIANFSSAQGNITFNGTVSAGAGSKAAKRSLVVSAANGTVTVNDQIGVSLVDRSQPNYQTIAWNSYSGTTGVNPYAVDINAGSIRLNADITSFETQRYVGPVSIGNNGTNGTTRLLASLDPSITFLGAINDTVEGQHTLILRAISLNAGNGQVPVIQTQDIGKTLALAGFDARVGVQWDEDQSSVADIAPTTDAAGRAYSDASRKAFIGQIDIDGSVSTIGDQIYAGQKLNFNGTAPILRSKDGSIEMVWGLNAPNNGNINIGKTVFQRSFRGLGAGSNLAALLGQLGIEFDVDLIPTADAGDLHQQKDRFVRRREVERLEQGLETVSASVEIGKLEDASGTMVRVSAVDGGILSETDRQKADSSENKPLDCSDQVFALNNVEICR